MLFRPAVLAAAALSTLLCGTLSAGSALALEGIDLSRPLPTPAAGECPLLVQIKYPFLRCDGGTESSERALPANTDRGWESVRQIPRMSDWTESQGTWGPEQHQN
jgi:hypothetical protein